MGEWEMSNSKLPSSVSENNNIEVLSSTSQFRNFSDNDFSNVIVRYNNDPE